ncbi:MAG: right-handed parallel beta-helix repeat-containing protein, partial [Planctomycetes bacterium]|nr:right-handed parallel beta-helix repeat-containing protein [Planctomycetota bacterium]
VTDCTFRNNKTDGDGGGIANYDESDPNVIDCTFFGNTAKGDGGGMYNTSSSPTVTNCAFTGNSGGLGGGMDNSGYSYPIVTGCNFTENPASSSGGGMNNLDSSPTVSNCTFTGNSADEWDGGGMMNYNSSPKVSNCIFTGNSAQFYGGGMHNNFNSSPIVTGCNFTDNSANYGEGGGMNNLDSSPTVSNCTFTGNSADNNRGGGMSNQLSDPNLTNCLFAGNNAAYVGGGMNINNSNPILINCTFADNIADGNGGGIQTVNSSLLTLTNSIVWSNDPNAIFIDATSSAVVNYSNIEGGYPGLDNLDVDPDFIDSTSANYRLQMDSPCIDVGDKTSVPSYITSDLDGRDRIFDGDFNSVVQVDMGAYEFNLSYYPVCTTFNSDLEGWLVTGDNSTVWEATTGDPNGCLSVDDWASGDMNYAIAPSKYHGDWSHMTALDTLSVDILHSSSDPDDIYPAFIFRIAGPGGAAYALSGAPYLPV